MENSRMKPILIDDYIDLGSFSGGSFFTPVLWSTVDLYEHIASEPSLFHLGLGPYRWEAPE